MKKLYLSLALLFMIGFASSLELGNSTVTGVNMIPEPPPAFDNNTANVNSSEFWVTNLGSLDNANSTQFANSGGTLNLQESWLNGIYVPYQGANQDLNLSNNSDILIGTGSAKIGSGSFSNRLSLDGGLSTIEIKDSNSFYLTSATNADFDFEVWGSNRTFSFSADGGGTASVDIKNNLTVRDVLNVSGISYLFNTDLQQNDIININNLSTNLTETNYLLGKDQEQIFFRNGGGLNNGAYLWDTGGNFLFGYSDQVNYLSKFQLDDNSLILSVGSGLGISNSLTMNGSSSTFSGKVVIGDPTTSSTIFQQDNVYGDSFLIDLRGVEADGVADFMRVIPGDGSVHQFGNAGYIISGATGSTTTPSFKTTFADTSILNGNQIFLSQFKGTDSALRVGAQISATASATWGTNTNDAPTDIRFYTQSDGTVNALGNPAVVVDRFQDLVIYNGVAFESTKEATIEYDGTNLVIITNATGGTGLLWLSNNISTTGVITRTTFWDDARGRAVDYIKNVQSHEDLNDFEKATYPVTDLDRPINVTETYEQCDEVEGSYGTQFNCYNVTQIVLDYPFTKEEVGNSLEETVRLNNQALRESLDGSKPVIFTDNSTGIITSTIIADNILTNSRTIEDGVDYIDRFGRAELETKASHPSSRIMELENGTIYNTLDGEDRIVNMEGYLAKDLECTISSITWTEYKNCKLGIGVVIR